ncbi:MAG: polyphosphate kinase 2 family protein [Myxococcales bacterium]|nr:polyphosphate kinase 2 family protein [Myxococcales bacterium]
MYGTKFSEPQDKRISLAKISTEPPEGLDREAAEAKFAGVGEELFELQQLMYGAGTHSLLVVLQGRDAAGKDGTVKHVVGWLNPRGVEVASFGVPSELERDHDFLWRAHLVAPRRGHATIFNRSHYEDVLVVRVDKLAPQSVWRARYEQINQFEALLASANTIIVKLMLHISPEEQAERFVERELDATKAFKLNVGDWKKRTQWRAYTQAYEDAIARCASAHAPWVVVPADKKWFRNLVVAEALRDALAPHKRRWRRALDELGKEQLAALEAYRATPAGAKVAATIAKQARGRVDHPDYAQEPSDGGAEAPEAAKKAKAKDKNRDKNRDKSKKGKEKAKDKKGKGKGRDKDKDKRKKRKKKED